MLSDNTNCLGLALKQARKDYVGLMTIIPICFLIIEIIHIFSRIYDTFNVPIDTIKTSRMIVSIISAIAFLWLTLGGIQEYIRNGYKDVRTIWWIVQGIEEMFLFILLAIYQHVNYDNTNIVSSFWFWAGIDIFVGIIIWIVLSYGMPVIPEQKWMAWIKAAQIVWISVWIGYKPADKDFDVATVVILLVTGILTFYYLSSLNKKNYKSRYIIGFILTFILPAAILIASLFVKENKILEWVYALLLILTSVLYILIVIREFMTSNKNKLPPI